MHVQCVGGAAADVLLADGEFRAQWSGLCERCPWATAYQTPEFALAWYSVYRARWTPLLLVARDSNGNLLGLLTLAVSPASDHVVVAGAHQAEYQAWVCQPDAGGIFPHFAIEALRREFPSAVLDFRYLPPGTPAAWVAGPYWSRTCLLKVHPRPLLRLRDGTSVHESLKKCGNKRRVRRLSQIGRLELRHVTDVREFETVFDTVIRYYDARRIAVNGSSPFSNDPLKRPFHLAMADVRGLLHVTVLRAGDQIVSAHVDVCRGRHVQLGLIAHNPALARHSPGKLHILLLAQSLMKDGYEQLDLTPGGEPYKSRFANAWDEVHTLTVFPTVAARRVAAVRAGFAVGARAALKVIGATPAKAESVVARLTDFDPVRARAAALSLARAGTYSRRETRFYRHAGGAIECPPSCVRCNRNSIEDLLVYQQVPGLPSRRQFISSALARMENGEDLYTRAEGGRLVHFAWLAERPIEEFARAALPGFLRPEDDGNAVIVEFFTLPDARGRGLATTSLWTMVRDAALAPTTKSVYVAVPADANVARRLVERVGFTHAFSVFERRWLGWSHRWCAPSAGPARAAGEAGDPRDESPKRFRRLGQVHLVAGDSRARPAFRPGIGR